MHVMVTASQDYNWYGPQLIDAYMGGAIKCLGYMYTCAHADV